MSIKRNDDAVSPVIGVILMVAITVILAAVIAAFVFNLVPTSSGHIVQPTVQINSTNDTWIDVTWSGGDLASITQVNVTQDGGDPKQLITKPPTVGQISAIDLDAPVRGSRVMLIATFTDGNDQIIFNKNF